jgi:hypothetical protein
MELYDSHNIITIADGNHLFFSDWFNKSITNLPKVLLSKSSKSSNIYLSSIKYITFGHSFNQPVDNLPDSILGIKFGNGFNQQVNNLPINLLYLEFGSGFNQSVDKLPVMLSTLIFFYDGYSLRPEYYKPSGTSNASKIDSIQLFLNFDWIVCVENTHTLNNLPNNLKTLQINQQYLKKEKINNLPIGLSKLKIPLDSKDIIQKIPFDCEVIYI